ncbi:hypothetical protein GFS31_26350 [Leptolyngbya sp. BL0902]|nr:hypothetical protein GFS31_26350 [Leptolyngbya sp. BL0902]
MPVTQPGNQKCRPGRSAPTSKVVVTALQTVAVFHPSTAAFSFRKGFRRHQAQVGR